MSNTLPIASEIKRAKPDRPILEVFTVRYSPYAFEPRAIEPEKLLTCLEAARWAASSFNEQPWSYLLATRDDAAGWEKMLGCLMPANQGWAKNAGALLIGVVKRTFTRNNTPNRVAEHDLGLASGQLTIQAVALGLAVHQMAGIDQAKTRIAYHIPEGFDPWTAVAIGYAADPAKSPDAELAKRDQAGRARKPLKEFVFGSEWQQAAGLVR